MSHIRGIVILLVGIGLIFLKRYNNLPWCGSKAQIEDKVVIVTGGNTGIGKETVRDLARRGGQIVLACRSLEKCRKTIAGILDEEKGVIESGQLHALELDLASLESVRQFVAQFKKACSRLDILINNAGVMCAAKKLTAEGFESTFGVNHLGHFLLTNLLLDILKSSAPSRVVTVASEAHWHGNITFENLMSKDENCFVAYAKSKLSNVLFSRELGRRLKGTGVTAYSLHPGSVYTDMGRDFQINNFWPMKYLGMAIMWPFSKDNLVGAQTTVCCAVDPALAHQTGEYYKDCAEAAVSPNALDDQVGQLLWTVSAKMVKLKDY